MITLELAAADFLLDLATGGRSERTIGAHKAELRRFGAWLSAQGLDWRTITGPVLKRYTRGRVHLGFSSNSNMLTTLRKFYAWAVDDGLAEASPATGQAFRTPKRPKAAPRALSELQLRRLVEALQPELAGGVFPFRPQRDATLLLFALYTGLRAGELAALRWDALDLDAQRVTVRDGKSGGRTVAMHPALGPLLIAWRETQRQDGRGPVFALQGYPAVRPNQIGRVARRWARALDLPLTAHVLRHSFATAAIRRSGNLYAVSKALGHAQLQQTQVYLRADGADSVPAVSALPGLGEW